jgi:predicted choloylglycine hydrolase
MENFKGNHFEVGQQIGAYYARHGVCFNAPTDEDLLRKQVRFYEENAPEILDEIRGIANGGSFVFENVAHKVIVSGILSCHEYPNRSCSIGGFIDHGKKTWVVRNYDWHPAVAENYQFWKFDFPDRTVVGLSDMDIVDEATLGKDKQLFFPDDAINSDGLFIGLTYAYCWSTGIGLAATDALKLVSWRCKNVDEAIDLLSNTKLACPKNYFIADRFGKMAVVQHAVSDFDVRYPDSDGFLVLANHYPTAMAAHEQVLNFDPNHSTFSRYSRLMKDLKELHQSNKEISHKTLEPIMTDPSTPVCQFLPDIPLETVWTLLLQQNDKQYRLITNPRSQKRVTTDFTL